MRCTRHWYCFLSFVQLRYANNSNYKNDTMIRKEMYVNPIVLDELRRIVEDSEVRNPLQCYHDIITLSIWSPELILAEFAQSIQIMKEDDIKWPEPDRVGRQELEIVLGGEHISFATTKLGSLLQVQSSEDPEGLRVFYYLIQDIKCMAFSLINSHFKIQPISRWK